MDDWQQEVDAKLAKILISEAQIKRRIKELGQEITSYYRHSGVEHIMAVGVLCGVVIVMSDLIREIRLPLTIDFMALSSYGSRTESSGTVRILKDLSHAITNQDVLIVEDIVDTGLTLTCLLDILEARHPRSLKICSLLSKPSRRKAEVKIDFCGFEVPDEFVVGYGLDYRGAYRNLPFIGVLKPEVYAASPE